MKKTGQTPQQVIVIQPRRGSSFGLASIIVGILGLLICWIPFFNMLGLPLSGLGLVLAALGFLIALARKGAGLGFSIAGMVICGLALFVADSINEAASDAIKSRITADAKKRQEQHATNQQVIGVNPATVANPKPTATPPVMARQAEQGAASVEVARIPNRALAVTPSPSPTPQEETWAPADQAVKQGDIMVKVVGLAVSKIKLDKEILGQPMVSQDPGLWIQLQITNTNPTMKADYRTWAGANFSRERDYATLADNFGNLYKRVDFGSLYKPLGRVDEESIYPNQYISDILVFEPPVPNAQYLNLELPAANFGGKGMLRIRIQLHTAAVTQP